MKNLSILATLALGALGSVLPAQDEPAPQPRAESKSGGKAAEYVQQLGDDSFKVRLQAEQELRKMGKDALPALREAAGQDGDAERQWRARRLLRQIERGETGGLGRRSDERRPDERGPGDSDQPRLRGWTFEPFGGDVQERFDRLFRDLERDFGMDIPRSRFFDDNFFKDLQDQMRDMQQRMQGMQGGVGSGQRMSMQVGPDGVRVEIKRTGENGQEESQVYEAPDLETFRQKYPGVMERNGLGGGFLFRTPLGGGDFLRLEPFRRHRDGAPEPDPVETPEPVVVPPPGKRLGVVVRPEVPADLRSYLGLEDGEGLMVDEVQDGTLARSLGIQEGDIVLQIAGRKIGGTQDVQDALSGVEAGATVEVAVLRRGKRLELRAEKPADEPAPQKGLQERRK